MPAIYESMTKIQIYGYDVRIWRTQPELKPHYDNIDLFGVAEEMKYAIKIPGKDEVVKKFLVMDRVAAVEVIDRLTGDGMVAYNDWP